VTIREVKNLREILESRDAVLIDACVYCGPLHARDFDGARSPGHYKSLVEFYGIMEDLFNMYRNIYTPESVAKELLEKGRYPYKRLLKSARIQGKKVERENVQARGRADKRVRTFLRRLECEGRILDFGSEKDHTYRDLISISGDFPMRYGISLNDLDFLLSGATLAKDGLEVALLSNDFGIVSAWHTLLNRSHISPERLEFYVMSKFNLFEQMGVLRKQPKSELVGAVVNR